MSPAGSGINKLSFRPSRKRSRNGLFIHFCNIITFICLIPVVDIACPFQHPIIPVAAVLHCFRGQTAPCVDRLACRHFIPVCAKVPHLHIRKNVGRAKRVVDLDPVVLYISHILFIKPGVQHYKCVDLRPVERHTDIQACHGLYVIHQYFPLQGPGYTIAFSDELFDRIFTETFLYCVDKFISSKPNRTEFREAVPSVVCLKQFIIFSVIVTVVPEFDDIFTDYVIVRTACIIIPGADRFRPGDHRIVEIYFQCRFIVGENLKPYDIWLRYTAQRIRNGKLDLVRTRFFKQQILLSFADIFLPYG